MLSRLISNLLSRRLNRLHKAVAVSPIGTWPLAPKKLHVDSSAIKTIDYHAGKNELDVEFVNGSVYRYFDVPAATYQALAGADSVGKEFVANVRNEFSYQQLRSRVKPPVKPAKKTAAAV